MQRLQEHIDSEGVNQRTYQDDGKLQTFLYHCLLVDVADASDVLGVLCSLFCLQHLFLDLRNVVL